MIDHFNIPVGNLNKSKQFYLATLASLDLTIIHQEAEVVGFGKNTWVFGIEIEDKLITPLHFAFVANTRDNVQQFYSAAINSGGRDNGAPGLRAEYGATYYAAYVIDPDGHNIEAVCRT